MARVVAFLRAINVGGRDHGAAQALFEAEGLGSVGTFITSGNVIFESRATRLDRLEATLAAHLEAELGYGVAVFLRTGAELAAIASHPAFPPGEVRGAYAVHVAFLGAPPSRAAARTVAGFTTAEDAFPCGAGRSTGCVASGPATPRSATCASRRCSECPPPSATAIPSTGSSRSTASRRPRGGAPDDRPLLRLPHL
ncbi:MAG: DUF1697 domain-containing protein [Gemmatimonadetes bacterium]|nr:DUF1697 domain-containing protein [Gemmatimonadota bacterium]